jgi:antirestriction protein ArdC
MVNGANDPTPPDMANNLENKDMAKLTAYDVITNKVIAQLEEVQASNWTQPWVSTGSAGLHLSMSTGKAYRGINQFLLMMSGRCDNRWGTYKAWQEKGAQVLKGEKGTQVVFFNLFEKTRDDGSVDKIPFAKLYTVFNAEQVEGAPALPVVESEVSEAERDAAVEEWIAASGADIRHGQSGAYYKPTADYIGMPDLEAFTPMGDSSASDTYYGTLLHEMTHWTGHRSRLDRLESFIKFGDDAYAFEELIAEMGAVFACAALGVEATPRPDHAEYIAHWLKVLRKDSRAIVSAAKQAQLAFEYIDAFSTPTELSEAA